MNFAGKPVTALSFLLIGLGIILMVARIVFGEGANLALPMVFLMLGGAFFLLVFALRPYWQWADLVFLPAGMLAALGVIFLFNILTNDWNAWAYAWLLLPAGLGAGLALAGRADDSRPLAKTFLITGLALVATSLALFVLFGAITGGLFIQIIAPFLLIAGGVSLRWLPLGRILPASLRQRLRIPDPQPVGTPTPVGAPTPMGAATAAPPLLAEKPTLSLAEPLSQRELEVMRLVSAGLSNQEIAARLNVAASTVKTHINNIYGKLGVETRIQAINRAREAGLLDS